MGHWLSLLALTIFACQAPAQAKDSVPETCTDADGPLFPFSVELPEDRFTTACGKKLMSGPRHAWGFVTASGCVAIPPTYETVEPFSDGLAVVGVGQAIETGDHHGLSLRYGAIDTRGKMVIPASYLHLESFEDGYSMGMVSELPEGEVFSKTLGFFLNKNNERLGDAKCGVQVNLDPSECTTLSNGVYFDRPQQPLTAWKAMLDAEAYAALEAQVLPTLEGFGDPTMVVSTSSTPGRYYKPTGELAFDGWFAWGEDFHEGLAAVAPLGRSGIIYIDRRGQSAMPETFVRAEAFSEGYAVVYQNSKDILMSRKGRAGFSTPHGLQGPLTNGLIRYVEEQDDKRLTGLLDRQGRVVVQAAYDEMGLPGDGLVAVSAERLHGRDQWRFIATTGETPAPLKDATFEGYTPPRFINGVAQVRKTVLLPEGTHYEWSPEGGAQKPGTVVQYDGLLRRDGTWLIEPTREWIESGGVMYNGAGFCNGDW